MKEALPEQLTDMAVSLGEVGLDAVLDEGLLRDIPFLSTALDVVRTARSIPDLILRAKDFATRRRARNGFCTS